MLLPGLGTLEKTENVEGVCFFCRSGQQRGHFKGHLMSQSSSGFIWPPVHLLFAFHTFDPHDETIFRLIVAGRLDIPSPEQCRLCHELCGRIRGVAVINAVLLAGKGRPSRWPAKEDPVELVAMILLRMCWRPFQNANLKQTAFVPSHTQTHS